MAVAVNYFDRVLSRAVVPPGHLQLAALACISLAAKQHERSPLSKQDLEIFAEICSPQQLRLAEQNMLFSLDWDANTLTPLAVIDLLLSLVSDHAVSGQIRKSAEGFFDIAVDGACMGGHAE
jgi:hypothetical protein